MRSETSSMKMDLKKILVFSLNRIFLIAQHTFSLTIVILCYILVSSKSGFGIVEKVGLDHRRRRILRTSGGRNVLAYIIHIDFDSLFVLYST